jgi:hypothetical protein
VLKHFELEETHEYLDSAIRSPFNCMAWRFYGVPRGGRTDPSLVAVRRHFAHIAFRYGLTHFLSTGIPCFSAQSLENGKPRLGSECDFLVQFWRTRERPDQFADAMRDAERFRNCGRVERSKSTGRCDHRALGEFLWITGQGRGFQPAKEAR